MVVGHSSRETFFKNNALFRYTAHYLNVICVNYLGIDLDNHNHPATK